MPSYAVTAATNHLTAGSYTYDASGSLTNDGANTLAYDAEGRTISSSGAGGSATYSYDGNGLRVKKTGSTTTVYIFSGGKDIAEYDNGAAPGSPTKEFIYAGGKLIMNVSGGTTSYFHQDRLSNRVLTSTSGAVTAQRGHFPFGEAWYESGNTKWKFTTYERDNESGNDYAMARYHASRLGRFSSPDPLGGSLVDPQSFNRYTYTQNDPINSVDPLGLRRGLPCTDPDAHCYGGGGGDGLGLFYLGGGFAFGGGGGACMSDGVNVPCSLAYAMLNGGAAAACPHNRCQLVTDSGSVVHYQAFSDGSAGYLPYDAPAGYSVQDIANAQNQVNRASAVKPIPPDKLTGKAATVYNLLLQLGVSADNITIYQNGTESFGALLTETGFDQLQNSSLIDSNPGDVFLHYPYTDGARSDESPSLHYVWFNQNLTDYVGGNGVYMQFHADSSNPYNGGFLQHWGCDVFHISCHN